MSRTWAYLDTTEHEKFKQKAQSLGITEYNLIKKLVQIYLDTPMQTFQPKTCLNCHYYQIANSNIIQALMKVNEALTLIQPEYQREQQKKY